MINNIVDDKQKNIKYTFNSKPLLLSYETPLKTLTRHLIKNKLKKSQFSSSSSPSTKEFVIFVKGGVTFREYRDVMEQSRLLNKTVYLVSDKIIK